MGGFARIDDSTWATLRTMIPKPWPRDLAAQDLRYWASLERAHVATRGNYGVKERPGRPALAATWGWGEKAARLLLKDVSTWWDPAWGPVPPYSEGPAKGQRRASEGPENDPQGSEITKAEGQPRASEGPAKGLTRVQHRSTDAQDPEDQNLSGESNTVDREDPADPVSSSDEPAPPGPKAPHWTVTLWAELQAVRAKHEPESRGQGLTRKRRDNLRSRTAELRQAGMDRTDLLRAARWVYESANMCASGARKTKDPLGVLLRPAHCVDYCELAEAEERLGADAGPAAPPKPAGDPDGLTRGQLSTIDDCRLDLLDEWPDMPAEVQARAVELLRAAMQDGIYTMKAMKDRVRPLLNGPSATVIDFARRVPAGGAK